MATWPSRRVLDCCGKWGNVAFGGFAPSIGLLRQGGPGPGGSYRQQQPCRVLSRRRWACLCIVIVLHCYALLLLVMQYQCGIVIVYYVYCPGVGLLEKLRTMMAPGSRGPTVWIMVHALTPSKNKTTKSEKFTTPLTTRGDEPNSCNLAECGASAAECSMHWVSGAFHGGYGIV